MPITCKSDYLKNFVTEADINALLPKLEKAHKELTEKSGAGNDFLGWYDLPENYDKEEFARIKKAADKIKKDSDIFIAIGIGGSYLGARAAIEFIKSPYYNNMKKDTPDIYFAGNTISSSSLAELLKICEGKNISINVISKSGTTTEPGVAFRVFRELLEKKYGKEEAAKRIYITTDKARGNLKKFADANGCETFVIPDDVGGRYSVLTACGLLPIAVAGIDLDAIMRGAAKAASSLKECDITKNDAYKYAVLRNALLTKGKVMEIMACYEPAFQYMNEWWKQLFGESEGKDGKGIFPVSVIYSTDLHSLGQIIQEGQRNIFETVVDIKKSNDTVVIPNDEENIDGMNFLSGKELTFVNHSAYMGTVFAHLNGGVPNIVLELDSRSEEDYGYMVYFFELACAISGYILGVNPFNQPGVEAYKKNMFALLGKPGEENAKRKAELDALMESFK
mgnify:FL=1